MAPPRTSLAYRVTFPFLKAAIQVVMHLLAPLRIEGCGNVPRSGGVLITPNHLSDCDPFAVTVGLRRRAWHMGKAELFEMPVVGAFCRFCQTFAVKRGQPDREALRMAEALLRAGEAVLVFPEGRLSETGLLQPMYSGVALLALRTGVPVVPVGLTGTDS
ncbi:MAG TPA: lysophospholipid acyltransferase family protein, partial [Armatimonadota bacterium]